MSDFASYLKDSDMDISKMSGNEKLKWREAYDKSRAGAGAGAGAADGEILKELKELKSTVTAGSEELKELKSTLTAVAAQVHAQQLYEIVILILGNQEKGFKKTLANDLRSFGATGFIKHIGVEDGNPSWKDRINLLVHGIDFEEPVEGKHGILLSLQGTLKSLVKCHQYCEVRDMRFLVIRDGKSDNSRFHSLRIVSSDTHCIGSNSSGRSDLSISSVVTAASSLDGFEDHLTSFYAVFPSIAKGAEKCASVGVSVAPGVVKTAAAAVLGSE